MLQALLEDPNVQDLMLDRNVVGRSSSTCAWRDTVAEQLPQGPVGS